jgi:hypothetical protein
MNCLKNVVDAVLETVLREVISIKTTYLNFRRSQNANRYISITIHYCPLLSTTLFANYLPLGLKGVPPKGVFSAKRNSILPSIEAFENL